MAEPNWQEIRSKLIGIAVSQGVRYPNVDDCVQTVMMKYFATGCPDIYASSYWYLAVRNWVRDQYRRRQRNHTDAVPLSQIRPTQEPASSVTEDSLIDVWDALQHPEGRRLLWIGLSLGTKPIPHKTRLMQYKLRRKLTEALRQ